MTTISQVAIIEKARDDKTFIFNLSDGWRFTIASEDDEPTDMHIGVEKHGVVTAQGVDEIKTIHIISKWDYRDHCAVAFVCLPDEKPDVPTTWKLECGPYRLMSRDNRDVELVTIYTLPIDKDELTEQGLQENGFWLSDDGSELYRTDEEELVGAFKDVSGVDFPKSHTSVSRSPWVNQYSRVTLNGGIYRDGFFIKQLLRSYDVRV